MKGGFTVLLTAAGLWTPFVSAGSGTAPASHDPQRLERSEEAMGTTFSVVLYGADGETLERAAESAFAEVHRVDGMLSNYRAASEWSAVNRSAALGAVKVSDELFRLLAECIDYSKESGGAFDITVGPLLKAWGFYNGEGALPPTEDLARARARVGYNQLRLDPIARTVRFDRAGIELDPGGIGKGYAVDRVADVLRRMNVQTALVSAGGSSIYGMGAPPDEPQGWRISIRAPRDLHSASADVALQNMSLSTSGSYEKFFRARGRIWTHIIDPRTGYPARGASSVSVVARRAIDSEAWTKPYFINGREWTAAHRRPDLRVYYCDDGIRPACGWID
jgi:thiamine biosynthesis lipoprotein